MDNSSGRSGGAKTGSGIPKDVDTVRPPGEGGEDAYSAQTVVRILPPEMLRQYAKALRPAALPKIPGEASTKPAVASPAPPQSDAEPLVVSTPEPASATREQASDFTDDEPVVHVDADEGGPLSAHAAVSTRHFGEDLARHDDEDLPAERVQGPAGQVVDKTSGPPELLGLWIGLGLIAAVAAGLLLGQCR